MTKHLPLTLVGVLALTNLQAQPAKTAHPKPQTPAPAPTAAVTPSPDAQQDELIQARKIPYRATLKRDPFGTMSDGTKRIQTDSIDETGVLGRLVVQGKPSAIILDSMGKTKFVQVGYQFSDGVLAAIDNQSVTFHQWDPGSTNRSKFKTIIRPFKREEGKR